MKSYWLTILIPVLLCSASVEAGLWSDLKNVFRIESTSTPTEPSDGSQDYSQRPYPNNLKVRIEQNKVYVTDGSGTVLRIIDNGRFYVKSAQVNAKTGMVCVTSVGSGGLSRFSLDSGLIIQDKASAGNLDNTRDYAKYHGDIGLNIDRNKLTVLDSTGRVITNIDNGCFDIESAWYDKLRDVIVVQSKENHKSVAYSFRSGTLTIEDMPASSSTNANATDEISRNVIGTTWTLIETGNFAGCHDIRFLAHGKAEQISDERYDPGRSDYYTWEVDGKLIRINYYFGYAGRSVMVREGRIIGERMEGESRSSLGSGKGAWIAEKYTTDDNCRARTLRADNQKWLLHQESIKQREQLSKDHIQNSVTKEWALGSLSGQFPEALAKINKGDTFNGYNQMKLIADSGDPRASNIMGLGVDGGAASREPLPSLAFEYYRKAAILGFPDAENNLGTMYHEGRGVKQDYDLAMKWYMFADLDNDISAAFNIGLLHEFGLGRKKDMAAAIRWYLKAEVQGDMRANDKLEVLDLLNLLDEKTKAKRYAAKKEPSKYDVLKVVLNGLSKYTSRGKVDQPDMLVKVFPVVGETQRSRILINDLQCTNQATANKVSCSFVVNEKHISGLAKAIYGDFLSLFSLNKTISVTFIKGNSEWNSPELDQKFIRLGADEKRAAEAAQQSGRSYEDWKRCVSVYGGPNESSIRSWGFCGDEP